MSTLFEGPAPRVRAIAASLPFLDTFVDALTQALWRADAPFALADALILLPNRRAADGLMDAFAKRLGGAALLPSIRPLGDLDDDVDVWGADPIALDLPPGIASTKRRLTLATLVRSYLTAQGLSDDPARALAMADELCRLLDSASAAERVNWSLLPTLVEERDLAAHWKQSATFLEIVTRVWPDILAAEGALDPSARRSLLLDALAAQWEAAPPSRPIVIAGSTGSVAATRRLMRVVAALPRGVVVLPGLDADLDDAAWRAIDPQHPQFALRETLGALGLERADVRALGAEEARGAARRVLVREALVPADATADWLGRITQAGGPKRVADGLGGLELIEAANGEEEAAVVALLMREALEDPAASVALVTPDAALSRRVAEKLARWNISPAMSHGRALRETAAGSLLALLCELARDSGSPVALAGLLKHALAGFGMAPASLAAARVELEHAALRGARRHDGAETLAARAKGAAGAALAENIARALAPLSCEGDLGAFADALCASAELVAATPGGDGARVWAGQDGAAARKLAAEAREHGAALGVVTNAQAARAFIALLDGAEALPERGGDPRCAIWGPLEARLQRRDVMILGGLNEGAWPAPPPEDPFLTRTMRADLGLPSPDARIGLAAHDFAQLACAPRVVMTRALKRGGAPSVASRWIWRLETLVRGAGAALKREAPAIAWAHALDAATAKPELRAPQPKPPADQRLKRLSITDVETLIRDPYAIFAKRVLGLDVLRPVGYEPGAAERGTAIHGAIEIIGAEETEAALIAALDRALAEAGFGAARRTAERARLAASARAYLAWARTRDGEIYREKKGELALADGRVLSGIADRIEVAHGHGVIVDVKSGSPPTDKQVKSGLSPQLSLEGAMLRRGAFAGVPAARARELIYWKFGGAQPAPRVVDVDADAAGEEALAALEKLLARYAQPGQPFLSSPRVQFMRKWTDYDQLARRKEWADAEADET